MHLWVTVQKTFLTSSVSDDFILFLPILLENRGPGSGQEHVNYYIYKVEVQKRIKLIKSTYSDMWSLLLLTSDQRGENQTVVGGVWTKKPLSQMSWRGLIRNAYQRLNVTLVCECDHRRGKKTHSAIINHILRRHAVYCSKNPERIYTF